MADQLAEKSYAAIYYQTIRDLGIDPVVCGDIPVSIGLEGCEESGVGVGVGTGSETGTGQRPVQLAEKVLAKASGAPSRAPRKQAPRKATRAAAVVDQEAKVGNARVPSQPAKIARGVAKVVSSG